MKSKIKYNNDCECHLEIEIPAETVDYTFKQVYEDVRKHAKIPGFRSGKAPMDLLEKHHSEYAREEVMKRLIPAGFRQALVQKKIDPIGFPEISNVVFGKGKNLSFNAKLEVRPTIKLKKYTGIHVKTKKTSVSDEECGAMIERLRNMQAQFHPIKEKRPVVKDDYTVCDVEVFIEGKLITKKHENMYIQASKVGSMMGLGYNLVAANTGELKEIETELPADYPDKKYAGKKALFKILINEIRERVLPALDDEFAKDMGKENLQGFKDDLKKQLAGKKEEDRVVDMKNQVIDRLLKDYKISLPNSMVKKQGEILMRRFEDDLLSKGIRKDEISVKKKEFEGSVKEDAKNQVKIYFILEAVAEKEKIKIKKEDVDKKFESLAALSRRTVGDVRKHYEEKNLMDGFLAQLREEKTLDWILSVADVKEN